MPDATTLLSVTDHCLRSRDYINVIVAGKQRQWQWLDMDAAVKHCSAGLGIWPWASNDRGSTPDVVMACCGDVPTLEALAAVQMLRELIPNLKVRFINIVDLMTLQPQAEHPHGLSDRDFDKLFITDKPIIFAFHGCPWLIHRLTCRRTNHRNLHVRGYKEEGTTTTPFDRVVLNDLDRFHPVRGEHTRDEGHGGFGRPQSFATPPKCRAMTWSALAGQKQRHHEGGYGGYLSNQRQRMQHAAKKPCTATKSNGTGCRAAAFANVLTRRSDACTQYTHIDGDTLKLAAAKLPDITK